MCLHAAAPLYVAGPECGAAAAEHWQGTKRYPYAPYQDRTLGDGILLTLNMPNHYWCVAPVLSVLPHCVTEGRACPQGLHALATSHLRQCCHHRMPPSCPWPHSMLPEIMLLTNELTAWTCRWVWVGVGVLFVYIIGLNFVIAACLAYLPRKRLWEYVKCCWCLEVVPASGLLYGGNLSRSCVTPKAGTALCHLWLAGGAFHTKLATCLPATARLSALWPGSNLPWLFVLAYGSLPLPEIG